MPLVIGDMKFYDVPELAELLQMNERTIRRMVGKGELRGRKLGVKWYVAEATVQAYLSDTEADYSGDGDNGTAQ